LSIIDVSLQPQLRNKLSNRRIVCTFLGIVVLKQANFYDLNVLVVIDGRKNAIC